jgi:hypothetical protein
MHRLFCVGLVFLAGCQGTVGPVKRTAITDPIDRPCLTLDEQKERARDRLALPDTSAATGPRTYAENPYNRGP